MSQRARSQAREAALKTLYQLDLRQDVEIGPLLAEVLFDVKTEDARDFAHALVAGTREHIGRIDEEVEAVAINWNLKRMATIDRNILRLGTFELLFRPDLPPAVSINEAVQLAKRFSTKESGSFVNGILDKVQRRFAGAEGTPASAEPAEEAE